MNRTLVGGELKAVQRAFPVVAPTPPTQAQMIEACAAMFMANGNKQFTVIKHIEDMAPQELRSTMAFRNIFGDMAKTIASIGGPQIDNVGELMDALGLDQGKLHTLACDCHENSTITHGRTAGYHMQMHAKGLLTDRRHSQPI